MRRIVQEGDSVQVTCFGRASGADGQEVELFEGNRTSFVVSGDDDAARGVLRPKLDQVVLGMREGESKHFDVCPGDVSHPQSERDPSLVIESVPKGDAADVTVGSLARYRHEGVLRLARVVRVDQSTVTIDMNDPLAGLTLKMTVRVEHVSNAESKTSYTPARPVVVGSREFTLEALSAYDGRKDASIFLSVCGYVYDVSASREFYGPGAGYGFMAGNDATVVLARMQLNPELLNKDWSGLEKASQETLSEYIRLFNSKYACIGRVRDAYPFDFE
eukprot:g2079.t1